MFCEESVGEQFLSSEELVSILKIYVPTNVLPRNSFIMSYNNYKLSLKFIGPFLSIYKMRTRLDVPGEDEHPDSTCIISVYMC